MSNDTGRRDFLKGLAAASGTVVVAPLAVSCHRQAEPTVPQPGEGDHDASEGSEAAASGIPEVPMVPPEGWDPVAFNRDRGNAGAIPESYHADINGPEGVTDHLGKHLPYVPEVDPSLVPEGFLPIMWGDPELGYAMHPNSIPDPESAYPNGHWYDWVRIRKAVEGDAEEAESTFSAWPDPGDGDSGDFVAFGDGEITENGGRNTIYLLALPSDVAPGNTIRIYGHCLYHGEYVDFLTI